LVSESPVSFALFLEIKSRFSNFWTRDDIFPSRGLWKSTWTSGGARSTNFGFPKLVTRSELSTLSFRTRVPVFAGISWHFRGQGPFWGRVLNATRHALGLNFFSF
jgi:hypothetical protein